LRETEEVQVQIVDFPATLVAALEHHGPAHLTPQTTRKFIAWRIANGFPPHRHRTFGLHYNDERTTPPAEYRFDLCLTIRQPIPPNPDGLVNKTIPAGRYAVARHHGGRDNITTARYLHEVWLPPSGESFRPEPILFHYVNVGPNIRPEEMITDVYLPIE
jgi:AraC family transcriptional regulator